MGRQVGLNWGRRERDQEEVVHYCHLLCVNVLYTNAMREERYN